MDTQILMRQLYDLHSATPKSVQLLISLFLPVTFRKGMILSMPDHSFPILYFIETGLVRGVIVYQQEEYTSWVIERGFLLPATDLSTLLPATEYIEFLDGTTGWSLNLGKAESLAQTEPLMYRILLEIYQTGLQNTKIRELMLRLKQADKRFLHFKSGNEALVYKLKNHVLSSFLNIEDKYLFAIKKKYRA